MVSKETSEGVKVREKNTTHISVEERGDVELYLFAVTCHFISTTWCLCALLPIPYFSMTCSAYVL